MPPRRRSSNQGTAETLATDIHHDDAPHPQAEQQPDEDHGDYHDDEQQDAGDGDQLGGGTVGNIDLEAVGEDVDDYSEPELEHDDVQDGDQAAAESEPEPEPEPVRQPRRKARHSRPVKVEEDDQDATPASSQPLTPQRDDQYTQSRQLTRPVRRHPRERDRQNNSQAQQKQQQQQQQQQQQFMQQQQMQTQQAQNNDSSKNPLRLRLDLNLEIEIELKARIHGDLTLALL